MVVRTATIGHKTQTFADQAEFEALLRASYDFAGTEAKRELVESEPYQASFNVGTQEYTLITKFPDLATHDTYYDHQDSYDALHAVKGADFTYDKVIVEE